MKPDLEASGIFIKQQGETKYIFIWESIGYRREIFNALRCIISLSKLTTSEESVT